MRRLSKIVMCAAAAAAALLPASPAFADYNPCKGQAPGSHCRPACFYEVVVDPGDPANGIGPTIEIRETFC
ncbi:MAG: hypothetical protein M3273_07435 [Actinomycetota bacterium]|nr:hypothetical protein [Actinomycetota bacterium]